MPTEEGFRWFIDEVICFRGALEVTGWAFDAQQPVQKLYWSAGDGNLQELCGEIGLPSPDVAAQMGVGAENCRFRVGIPKVGALDSAASGHFLFTLADGRQVSTPPLQDVAQSRLRHDPYHQLQQRFFAAVHEGPPGGRALEIGSRNRSGNVRRSLLPVGVEYVGMDILDGDNVDLIGDAHELSKLVAPASFDWLLSVSVFEHLLMPWKAALEMNKVMKTGGLALIATHQTFPLHETPWDFFRFSDQAWHGLFNRATGFEIVATALGEPASIVPRLVHQAIAGLDACPAFIGSAVLLRKVGDTELSWPVELKSVVDSMYPSEDR